MKHILKFLNIYIITLIITLILDILGKLYALIQYLTNNQTTLEVYGLDFPADWSNPIRILFVIPSSILLGGLVYFAYTFRKVVTSFSMNNYFTSKNVAQLSIVGKGLIFYGIGHFTIMLLLNLSQIEFTLYNIGSTIGKTITLSIPIFIFSSFTLLIASIIKKGNFLQEENDLTI